MRFKKEYSFDEKKDAEYIIENGFADGKINYGDMQKVAKYFRNISGFGAVRLEKEIIKFCQKQEPDFNPIIERESIKGWIKAAMTNTLRKIDEIPITEEEAKTINSIKNLKERKLLFATLVMAKALKIGKTGINQKESTSEKYYIQYNKFGDIIRLSKINMTEIQLCDVYYEFLQMGLISLYSPEKEIISINFVDKLSPVVFTFSEQEKFLEYFNEYFKGGFIACSICGKEIVKNSNSHNRCEECSKEIRKKKERERIKKYRDSVRK